MTYDPRAEFDALMMPRDGWRIVTRAAIYALVVLAFVAFSAATYLAREADPGWWIPAACSLVLCGVAAWVEERTKRPTQRRK